MAEGSQGRSTLATVLIVVGVALGGVVLIIGLLAALGIAGVRNYLIQAKTAEGRSQVRVLAMGIARCAEAGGVEAASTPALPPSAPPVPASLGDVSAKKYMSSPSDWSAPAYKCASYQMSMPQYFQYEWQLSSPTSGRAIARADLDGDGKAEQELTAVVTCSGSTCSVVGP